MEERKADSLKIERVEDMPVYQAFYGLALDVGKATREYGPDFRWLRQQSMRASESVCANMAEGFYAQYSTEYVHSLYRCRREARETVTHLNYAKDAGIVLSARVDELVLRYEDAMRQLANLIGSVERKIEFRGKSKPVSGLVKEDGADYDVEQPLPFAFDINHQPSAINHEPLTIDH